MGMYRGLGPPVCMMMVMNSMNFGAFYHARVKLAGADPVELGHRTTVDRLARGVRRGGVGPLCAMVSTPFELVKLQVQLDAANHSRGGDEANPNSTAGDGSKRNRVRSQVLGSAHAARQLLKTHGPRVFFLGHGVNTARECVFNAVFFSAFEHRRAGLRRGWVEPHDSTAAAEASRAPRWLTNLPWTASNPDPGQCLGRARGMGRWAGREGRVRRGGEGGWREGRNRRLFRRRGSVAGAFFRGEREQVHGVLRGDGVVPRRAGAGGRVADGVGIRARLREKGRARPREKTPTVKIFRQLSAHHMK